jgi:hypothetical protein
MNPKRTALPVALALILALLNSSASLAQTVGALGTTVTLTDGSTVTAWEAYATGDQAPDVGTYIVAVSVTMCASSRPRVVNQSTTSNHFDLIVPRMLSGYPLAGFYGWDDTVILQPGDCYSNWLAYEVPNGSFPTALTYHEQPCTPNTVGRFAAVICGTSPSGFWELP